MTQLRHYGWLALGVAAAVAVSTSNVSRGAIAPLSAIAPFPWENIGLAALVLAAFAGLHFRQQLLATLATRDLDAERSGAASRLIQAAVSDGLRWLRVIQENLELVADGKIREQEAQLYLGGARAHADKLEQAFQRIEGTRRRLDTSS